jgi:ABC-type branched-subunit amino acid transport system ATPase component
VSALLEVDGLSKSFGGVHAVRGLEFELGEGESAALVGPNGAGKTTAFDIISGFVAPDAGRIRIAGVLREHVAPWRIARLGVTRTFQNVGLFGGLSVLQNLALGRPGRQIDQRARELCARFGLAPAAQVTELSYGQQKIVEIVRALATEPRLLLLDEPSSGVSAGDMAELRAIVERLREDAVAVLAIEHNIAFVRATLARTIVMADGAKIADGDTEDVLGRAEVLEAYFGVVAA